MAILQRGGGRLNGGKDEAEHKESGAFCLFPSEVLLSAAMRGSRNVQLFLARPSVCPSMSARSLVHSAASKRHCLIERMSERNSGR